MAAIFWHAGRWYEDEQPKLLGPDGPCHVDGEHRVRWRARFRRPGAGPGPALRAPDQFHAQDAARADHERGGGRGAVPRGAAPAAARGRLLRPADVLRHARLRDAGARVDRVRARGLCLADARGQGHGLLLLQLPAAGARRRPDRRQGELPLSQHAAGAGRGRPARLRQRDHLRRLGQRRRARDRQLMDRQGRRRHDPRRATAPS